MNIYAILSLILLAICVAICVYNICDAISPVRRPNKRRMPEGFGDSSNYTSKSARKMTAILSVFAIMILSFIFGAVLQATSVMDAPPAALIMEETP